jgi:hypothetical protein
MSMNTDMAMAILLLCTHGFNVIDTGIICNTAHTDLTLYDARV